MQTSPSDSLIQDRISTERKRKHARQLSSNTSDSTIAPKQQTNFNPHMGAKKLAVKNFRTQAKADPQLYLNQVWEKLDAALTVVFKNEKITFSLEELYRGVENLCRQGHAEEVCLRLQKKS